MSILLGKQYCRYCSYCIESRPFYCEKLDKELSFQQIRRANDCKHFDLSALGDVESGKPYVPRQSKKIVEIDNNPMF